MAFPEREGGGGGAGTGTGTGRGRGRGSGEKERGLCTRGTSFHGPAAESAPAGGAPHPVRAGLGEGEGERGLCLQGLAPRDSAFRAGPAPRRPRPSARRVTTMPTNDVCKVASWYNDACKVALLLVGKPVSVCEPLRIENNGPGHRRVASQQRCLQTMSARRPFSLSANRSQFASNRK